MALLLILSIQHSWFAQEKKESKTLGITISDV